MTSRNGRPLFVNAIGLGFAASDWMGHPDRDVDIAVACLQRSDDEFAALGESVSWCQIDRSLIPSDEVVADLDVIERVAFVGYPVGLYDTANLTPIFRHAVTATPIQLDYDGLPQFLVDASVFPGSSGSPVFIIDKLGYRQGNTINLAAPRALFLGILSAVHTQTDNGRAVTGAGPFAEFDQLMDLGVVFR